MIYFSPQILEKLHSIQVTSVEILQALYALGIIYILGTQLKHIWGAQTHPKPPCGRLWYS